MSVSSAGSSSNAYAYLQSLLQQGSTKNSDASGSADPLTELLAAFYPAGGSDQAGSGSSAGSTSTAARATAPPSSPPCPTFSPGTLGALISMQGQQSGGSNSVASRAQSLFGKIDADGDGAISKSEFEGVFGSNADVSKVDGLFNALDANADGSVSLDELTSAARQAQGHHHHHHHMHGGGSGQSGGLADLLSATNLAGASSQSATNADGSTTTTIGYADGTKIAMTVPASSPTGASSSGGSDSQTSSSGNNVIEQLIRLQAQMLGQSASAAATTTLPVS
jgi:hypothetical protein